MTRSRHALDDAALERLLSGRTVDGRPELEPVTTLVRALGGLEIDPPAPRGHLAALLAAGFDPADPPAAAADVPVWGPPVPARSRFLRRPAASMAGLSLAAKVLLGSGAAVAGVTTAASAGVLPDPVQDGVSAVVEAVTPFEVPRAEPEARPAEDGAPEPAPPSVPAGPPGPLPAPPADRPGESALPEQAPEQAGRPGVPGRTARPEQAEPAPPAAENRPAPAEPGPRSSRAAEPAPPAQQQPGQAPGPARQPAPGQQDELAPQAPAAGTGAEALTPPRR